VLALRAAAGASFGQRFRYGSFRLGGNYGESSFYVLPDEIISLRGWPVAATSGDWYYLGSTEYRFPIWRVDRGASTLPIFIRSIHGAVFTDIGSAFDNPDQAEAPLVGSGAEIRITSIIGWGLPIQARLGFATGWSPAGGIEPSSPSAWYSRIGSSF
jgi:outer membrane protein assembly factor BamA